MLAFPHAKDDVPHQILALKDGQVVIRYLQDDQGHGRAVFIRDAVVGPVTLSRLALQQLARLVG